MTSGTMWDSAVVRQVVLSLLPRRSWHIFQFSPGPRRPTMARALAMMGISVNVLIYCTLRSVLMSKIGVSLFVFAVSTWAADFWQVKPFTDWSDKDVQKMLTHSPWARSIGVSMSGPTAEMAGGSVDANSSGGGRGPGGAGQEGAPPISEQSGRGGRGSAPAASTPADVVADVVLRWQSALPVKQALARVKYGAEAGSSGGAKEILGRREPNYVIVATGSPLRVAVRGDLETIKMAALRQTMLSVKGKSPIKPSDIQINTAGRTLEVYFVFPRNQELTLDDKEVEFATKIGDLSLKNKFQLKNMVLNGTLDL